MLSDPSMPEPVDGASDSSPHLRRLLSFSQFTTYRGVPHAGGEYLLRHLGALKSVMKIDVVVGRASREDLARGVGLGWGLRVANTPRFLRGRLGRLIVMFGKALDGASLGRDVELGIRRDAAILALVRDADVVEFQWTESAKLAAFVRRMNPSATQFLVVHDLLTQRWFRRRTNANSVRLKVFYWLRQRSAQRAEKTAFSRVDCIVTFSEKDARLILDISPDANVHVMPPGLVEPGMSAQDPTLQGRAEHEVVFTGALDRPENEEAVTWFLENVWPVVRQAVPDSVFTIVGALPSEKLQVAARSDPRIRVTGYVETMDEHYRRGALFVVPLLSGAGVKFKTVSAMLWGMPVVSTSVGAEGVGSADNYLCISDDFVEFSDAVVKALLSPERRESVARVAHEWAHKEYGNEKFQRVLQELYTLQQAVAKNGVSMV